MMTNKLRRIMQLLIFLIFLPFIKNNFFHFIYHHFFIVEKYIINLIFSKYDKIIILFYSYNFIFIYFLPINSNVSTMIIS